MDSVIYKPCF